MNWRMLAGESQGFRRGWIDCRVVANGDGSNLALRSSLAGTRERLSKLPQPETTSSESRTRIALGQRPHPFSSFLSLYTLTV